VSREIDFTLYAILDVPFALAAALDLEAAADAALAGGAGVLQVRDDGDGRRLFEVVSLLLPLARRRRVPLIVNDRADVALAAGADGVHLGREDLPLEAARRILPGRALVGATARSVPEARAAEAEGASYVAVGSIFVSRTKEAPRMSVETAAEIAGAIERPVVAIGGIDAAGAARLSGKGLAGVAVSRAVFGAKDITAEAMRLREAFLGGG
jgi:thiamine-phosphate diphosphorylase